MPGNDQQEPRRIELFWSPTLQGYVSEKLETPPNDGWMLIVASEQATRQSARAEALRDAAGALRRNPMVCRGQHFNVVAADFLESLASDNEGKADGNGG
jgi:hypothetical protein